MKTIYRLIVFSVLAFCSCQNDNDSTIDIILGTEPVPLGRTRVYLQNAKGEDLLNPVHPDAVNIDSIQIYSVYKGDIYQLVNLEVELNPPSYVKNDLPSNLYSIDIPIAQRHDTASMDIIKWNETWIDTVSCRLPGSRINEILKVYVNNKLKWDINDKKFLYVNFVSPEGKKE